MNQIFKLFPRPAKSTGENVQERDGSQYSRTLARCSTSEARKLVEYTLAERLEVLPLGLVETERGEILTAVGAVGRGPELERELRFCTDKRVKVIEIEREALLPAIFTAYHGDDTELAKVVEKTRQSKITVQTSVIGSVPLYDSGGSDAAQFLAVLIKYALSKEASDIHLSPQPSGVTVKLRLDGLLYSHETAIGSLAVHQQLVSRLKVLCKLDTTCHAKPQDGSFGIDGGGQQVTVRVSILPTIYGERCVLRIVGAKQLLELSELGLDSSVERMLGSFLKQDHGMALFSGPTGSGKTTTMYAAINTLRSRNLGIATVEDPVEVRLPGVSQTEINEGQGLTYEAALRAILRQDPNIILLGEIRDGATAQLALRAALTGHLFLSSVHASSVFDVFLRLKDLGVDAHTLISSVSLIIAQRLVPRLCNCKLPDITLSRVLEEVRELNGVTGYQPGGCSTCNYSGFSGRILITEALKIDGALTQLLSERGLSLREYRAALTEEQYASSRPQLDAHLRSGSITYDDFIRLRSV